MRNPLRELSASPSTDPRAGHEASAPRLFWSPVLLSDAVRRLALSAHDREVEAIEKQGEDAHSILRIMSNLFTFPHQKMRRVSEHSRPTDEQTNYSLLPTRRSMVYIKDASVVCGTDIPAAKAYIFPSKDAVGACKENAERARALGRLDHQRVFGMLQVLLADLPQSRLVSGDGRALSSPCNPLTLKIVDQL